MSGKGTNINAIKRPSKQAIAEVASISGGRDILYSYVATENDHTVYTRSIFSGTTTMHVK